VTRLRDNAPSAGAVVLVAAAVGYALLWLLARPTGEPTARYVGEVCGAEAVALLTCTLVLATLLPAIEGAFGGLDRVAIWHRRTAVAAVLLLIPHWALATSRPDPYATGIGPGLGDIALLGLLVLSLWALAPKLRAARWPGPVRRLARATYERWLTAHRLTGLFVIAAVAHGGLVDPTIRRSTPLRVAFFAVGGLGIAAYLYRELIARFVVPIHDYTVVDVRRPNETTVEASLEPTREPLAFRPGQFIFLAFGGENGWQRHPFSIASGPSERRLEVAIKAAGDYTRELHEGLKRGTPAKVAGPFGGFDYQNGGREQVWIAGGIGITPFMSWIRALDGGFERDVDFFYSVAARADALFADEIAAAARQYPSFRPHLVVTDERGFLTPEEALGPDRASDVWIYLCGPSPMTAALSKGFRRLGVPAGRIRWEDFGAR
jgi:predicted ferric reductase